MPCMCLVTRVLTVAVMDVCGCPQETVTLPSTKFTKRPDTWFGGVSHVLISWRTIRTIDSRKLLGEIYCDNS